MKQLIAFGVFLVFLAAIQHPAAAEDKGTPTTPVPAKVCPMGETCENVDANGKPLKKPICRPYCPPNCNGGCITK
jgi:hypothetical protein